MRASIELKGVPQAIAAMQRLSRATQIRGTRIGLNAALGVIRDQAVRNLRQHQKTGVLAKSQKVKVRVPQASNNPAHWDKPAWGLVGAGKGIATVQGKRSVRAITLKTAAKSGAKLRTRIEKGQQRVVMPSRYSHFAEKKHHDLAKAAQQAGPAAQAKFAQKVGQFIQAEAAKFASKP